MPTTLSGVSIDFLSALRVFEWVKKRSDGQFEAYSPGLFWFFPRGENVLQIQQSPGVAAPASSASKLAEAAAIEGPGRHAHRFNRNHRILQRNRERLAGSRGWQ